MPYHLDFTDKATEDISAHKKAGNTPVLNKLLHLLEELTEHPFTGTGKPEPLRHNLAGMWARRINKEHRLVYEVEEIPCLFFPPKGIMNRQLQIMATNK